MYLDMEYINRTLKTWFYIWKIGCLYRYSSKKSVGKMQTNSWPKQFWIPDMSNCLPYPSIPLVLHRLGGIALYSDKQQLFRRPARVFETNGSGLKTLGNADGAMITLESGWIFYTHPTTHILHIHILCSMPLVGWRVKNPPRFQGYHCAVRVAKCF